MSSLADMPSASALDALRESTELVELLTGWRSQAIYAARCEGAAWEQIGAAAHLTAQAARSGYVEALDRLESVRPGTTASYREVL